MAKRSGAREQQQKKKFSRKHQDTKHLTPYSKAKSPSTKTAKQFKTTNNKTPKQPKNTNQHQTKKTQDLAVKTQIPTKMNKVPEIYFIC